MKVIAQHAEPAHFVLHVQQSIGDIAVYLPGATEVLRRFQLDYCCSGKVSLAQAAQDRQLDIQSVLAALAALPQQPATAAMTDPTVLVFHILAHYHESHREQLPMLRSMARSVEDMYRDHPLVPQGLSAQLAALEDDLFPHMDQEEEDVFPRLQAGGVALLQQPIDRLRSDHATQVAKLRAVMDITRAAMAPEDACTTWRTLYAGIARLHDDLVHHLHLENNILFPQFEVATPAPA